MYSIAIVFFLLHFFFFLCFSLFSENYYHILGYSDADMEMLVWANILAIKLYGWLKKMVHPLRIGTYAK